MQLQKKDFIEIEFNAKIKDGEIFDSNKKEELEKLNPKAEAKPFIFCLDEGMLLKGIDNFLIGKDLGEYKIELKAKDAFGLRDPKFIQRIPTKVFYEQKINPIPGMVLNFDGRIGKTIAVSGGRVIVDFNSPLAGKDVIYEIKILRKIEDINEKVKALNDFFFGKDFKFEIVEKKLILETEDKLKNYIQLFKDKYKNMIDLDLEIKGVEDKKEKENDKTSENSN